MRPSLALVLTAALAAGVMPGACAPFPDLDETITAEARRAPYPDLVPLEGLQARAEATRIDPGTAQTIEARAARLRDRAARLRGSVIDSRTRARMEAGVSQ